MLSRKALGWGVAVWQYFCLASVMTWDVRREKNREGCREEGSERGGEKRGREREGGRQIM